MGQELATQGSRLSLRSLGCCSMGDELLGLGGSWKDLFSSDGIQREVDRLGHMPKQKVYSALFSFCNS
jgi:hypothetical protein